MAFAKRRRARLVFHHGPGARFVSKPLTIRDHAVLPQCEAEAFRDDLVNNHGYTGFSTVANNDPTGICP